MGWGHRSAEEDLEADQEERQGEGAWAGKDALAFPRPHWWLTDPEAHVGPGLIALTPESRSSLLSRQTEGGQSFQRLASPAAWVGLCTRAVNSHRLGDFVSFHFFPAIKVIDSIHNIHSKELRHPTFQRQPLLTSFFFLHIIHVS